MLLYIDIHYSGKHKNAHITEDDRLVMKFIYLTDRFFSHSILLEAICVNNTVLGNLFIFAINNGNVLN